MLLSVAIFFDQPEYRALFSIAGDASHSSQTSFWCSAYYSQHTMMMTLTVMTSVMTDERGKDDFSDELDHDDFNDEHGFWLTLQTLPRERQIHIA